MRLGCDLSPFLTPYTWKRQDQNLGVSVPGASSLTRPRCLNRGEHVPHLAVSEHLGGLHFMEFERGGHTATTTYASWPLPSSAQVHNPGCIFLLRADDRRTFWNFLE